MKQGISLKRILRRLRRDRSNVREIQRPEDGQSIVEAVVAVALLTSFTVLIFPVFTTSSTKVRQGSIRKLCQEAVNLKLNQYRYGIPVDVGAAGATAPRLLDLTTGSYSDSSVASGGGARVSNGFFYAKFRYNESYPASCMGRSTASVFTPALQAGLDAEPRYGQTLGMRECLTPNPATGIVASWDEENEPAQACPTTIDGAAPLADRSNLSIETLYSQRVPGLKIYVRLELDSPWDVEVPAANNKFGQFVGNAQSRCPNFGSWQPTGVPNYGANQLYDFDGAGDGIRITVSGLIDLVDPVRVPISTGDPGQFREFMGGSLDPNRLFCTASATIYPYRMPVRYSVSGQGRIYSINGRAVNNREGDQQWILPTLYQAGGLAESQLYGGIRSIAVHPRNLSVYVLRRGEILRYSNCGGVPFDCSPLGNNTGLSDDGTATRPPLQVFRIPNLGLSGIGVDFRTGRVIGMGTNRQRLYEIASGGTGGCAAGTPLRDCATCTPTQPVACTVQMQDVPSTDPLVPPAYLPTEDGLSPRITGFFLSHSGEEGFVSASTVNRLFGVGNGAVAADTNSYGASIFRLRDGAQLLYPVITLPVNAVSFSK